MRTELPVAIACISGFIILIAHFFNIGPAKTAATHLQDWGIIVAAFAIVVSTVNLMMVHTRRLSNQREDSWKKVNWPKWSGSTAGYSLSTWRAKARTLCDVSHRPLK